MESAREKTCEEQINDSLENTISYIREMWEVYIGQSPETDEITEDSFHEYGLSLEYSSSEDGEPGFFRYLLSWGGPSSEFRFFTDPDLCCYRIEYWFLDWFDGASRRLYDSDKDLMLEIFDMWRDCGTLEYLIEQSRDY